MELMYPKKKYNIKGALNHASRNCGRDNIISYQEAGEKELNHIIIVKE